ncbi:MAG: SUMF1/EgtB/PvdO family nonheme iron enzyme [Prevotellaceae bacterium]|nr:SUMF1/EgtB/PvdO family nonheme iron enzyme [Candidatus Minthosoma caballi]
MLRRLYFSILFSIVAIAANAQKLTIESFTLDANDITASSQLRLDGNGDPCALIKVQLATQGAKFSGNTVGNAPYNSGEYWVYMTEGSKNLQVRHDNYLPLDVNFANYGINSLKAKMTYVLTLLLPSNVSTPVDAGGNFVLFKVQPATASVSIDNQPQLMETSGEYMPMLPYGQHSYEVSAGGYISQSGTFSITTGDTKEISVNLVSALATVTVSCPTSGVSIYLDKKQVGTAPWTGAVKEGIHLIEAKKDGYRSQQKTVTLSQQEKLSVSFDDLQAIVGNLSIAYRPSGSEIYIDGKKQGTSPSVISNLLVGNYTIEIKKSGYTSETKTVTISEGQTASLQGSLKEIASATPAQSANQSSSSFSDKAQTFTVKGVSFTMIPVAGGTFTMGATSEQGSDAESDEKPTHSVTLSSYMIGETEVTQALWEAVMGSNPSRFKGTTKPVEQVSWNDCQTFIDKLNSLTGKRFRLPTEAEWEYAARGGNKSKGYKYSGSNNIDDVAVYTKNSYDKGSSSPDYGTHAVKTKRPNELGIYDMSGNVWEWCSDWKGSYSSSSQTNPTGAASGTYRVRRGGSWYFSARGCRSSIRGSYAPGYSINDLGLRLVLSE